MVLLVIMKSHKLIFFKDKLRMSRSFTMNSHLNRSMDFFHFLLYLYSRVIRPFCINYICIAIKKSSINLMFPKQSKHLYQCGRNELIFLALISAAGKRLNYSVSKYDFPMIHALTSGKGWCNLWFAVNFKAHAAALTLHLGKRINENVEK